MAYTPYGYIIKNGKAIIDKKAAEQVRELFRYYLSGISLRDAADKAGIKSHHASIAKMLTNKQYVADDFYPQIIDNDIFKQVQAEKLRRAKMLGKIKESKVQEKTINRLHFSMASPKQIFAAPFMQAEYAYSLIESEVMADGE